MVRPLQLPLPLLKPGTRTCGAVCSSLLLSYRHPIDLMQEDKVAVAKLKAASALYYLKTKKYKLAALKFTEARRCSHHPPAVLLRCHDHAGAASTAAGQVINVWYS